MPLFSFSFFAPVPIQELIRRGDVQGLNRLTNREGIQALNERLDKDYNTPLILACSKGAYRVVNWLVNQKGLDLNARNRFGWTAVYEAAGTGHRHVLERLIQAGADPRIGAASWPRQTPAQMAKQMGWHACAEVLIEAEKVLKANGAPPPVLVTPPGFKPKRTAIPTTTTSSSSSSSSSSAPTPEETKTNDKGEEGGRIRGNGKEDRKLPPGDRSSKGGEEDEETKSAPEEGAGGVSSDSKTEEEGGAAAAAATGEAAEEGDDTQKKKELPACLRWQVEAGVGEWSNQRLAWDEDFDLLEVHPVVWSKRGPRVGRHRQATSTSSTVINHLRSLRKAGARTIRAPLPNAARRRQKTKRWIAQS